MAHKHEISDTLSDAYSRYLLCLKPVARPDHANCRSELEWVFREYGLPYALRSDNGAPFASVGAGGLSRLSVWWVKLGIMPERIEPGQPQQNGRHERMHRTLKAECASPAAATMLAQQRRFDQFRTEFNQQRPHEALGQTPPAKHYTPSARDYPGRLEDPPYAADFELRRVRSNGEIKWQGELVFIGAALTGEVIGLIETEDGDAEVFFGPVPLGIIDGVSLKLMRRDPGQRSTVGRGGQPPSRSSPAKSEKVLPMLPVKVLPMFPVAQASRTPVRAKAATPRAKPSPSPRRAIGASLRRTPRFRRPPRKAAMFHPQLKYFTLTRKMF